MTTSDEAVHEIQLNGKQLVFLFMAVTVVSVVIFLCGVLVGRGVQRRTALVDAPVMSADEASLAETGVDDAPAQAGPTTAPNLSFPEMLGGKEPPAETLAPTRESAVRPPPAAPPPAAAKAAPTVAARSTTPAPADAKVATSPSVPSEPRGAGFAVQVAAFEERGVAESLVKRLIGKGYAAYLVVPAGGPPTIFRVRVGKFPARSAAERVATRLEREEQFKPWITR